MREICVTLAVGVEWARFCLRLLSEGDERTRITPHYPQPAGPKSRQLLAGSAEFRPADLWHKSALDIASGTRRPEKASTRSSRRIGVRPNDI